MKAGSAPFLRRSLDSTVLGLKRGNIIAYPTDTVWGLGCDPIDRIALQKLRRIKQRPEEQGFILVAGSWCQFRPYWPDLPEQAIQTICRPRTRPCSWAVPDTQGHVLPEVKGQHREVVLRISRHPQVMRLTAALGRPLVSTSANPAGWPPAQTASQVRAYFGHQLDYIVPGSVGRRSRPSQIRDLTSGRVLRP